MHDPVAGLAPARQFGPWAPGLDPGERLARLRSLRALASVLAGPRASDLVELLRQAEGDPAALVPAADALDAMASLDMRRVLANYANLARPLPSTRRGTGRQSFLRPVCKITSLSPGPRQGWRVKLPGRATA